MGKYYKSFIRDSKFYNTHLINICRYEILIDEECILILEDGTLLIACSLTRHEVLIWQSAKMETRWRIQQRKLSNRDRTTLKSKMNISMIVSQSITYYKLCIFCDYKILFDWLNWYTCQSLPLTRAFRYLKSHISFILTNVEWLRTIKSTDISVKRVVFGVQKT